MLYGDWTGRNLVKPANRSQEHLQHRMGELDVGLKNISCHPSKKVFVVDLKLSENQFFVVLGGA